MMQGYSPKLLVDLILQSFAGLENGSFAGSDLDFFTGAGIAGNTGGTLLGFESAKADQLDLFTLGQSLADHIEKSIQSSFGIFLGHFGFRIQGSNQFTFIHNRCLLLFCCFSSISKSNEMSSKFYVSGALRSFGKDGHRKIQPA